MNGTANNYMAGNLLIGYTTDNGAKLQVQGTSYFASQVGFGSAPVANSNIYAIRGIQGGTTAYNFYAGSNVLSDVTNAGIYYGTNVGTQAATFTLNSLRHFSAAQATIGAGSTVTNQYGFYADSTLTGATNDYGFYGDIAAGTGRYNLYMNGTAANYLAGSLGIGSIAPAGYTMYVAKNITGATISYGVFTTGSIQSDVTGKVAYYQSYAQTAAATFTLSDMYHYTADQGTIGAGSTVTSQYGFHVTQNLTGATNNYGFYGNLAAAAGRWNLYMNGTANNYMAGSLGIGSTSLAISSLAISKTITGGTVAYSTFLNGVIQSDVTSSARYFNTQSQTAAATFTLSNLIHYAANQGTLGAGSTITNQYGFYVESNVTGATNNYGFFGNIPSASGRWNLYMNGTAANYMNGNLLLGSTTDDGQKLQVTGNVKINNGTFYYVNQYTQTGDFWIAASGTTNVLFSNGANNDFGRLQLGGTTASYPSIKRSSNNIEIKNANDTFGAGLSVGASLNASAILQADSTTKGFLPPRMTTTQKNAIGTPAAGLVIYDTTLNKLCVYTGAAWETITSA
jgi:hypothetical protein